MNQNKKNIVLLGLVSFVNDTASKIILPILPLFIQSIGGTGLAIGIISGLGESLASLFKMLAGYWSDKLSRRKSFVFWGYLTSSFSKLLLAFASTLPSVLLFRLMERLGKGLRSAPRDAILAASTEQKTRGKGFGIHRAMDSGGSVLGAIITFILFWYLGLTFSRIFFVAGVISFFSLLPLIFVQEKKQQVGLSHFIEFEAAPSIRPSRIGNTVREYAQAITKKSTKLASPVNFRLRRKLNGASAKVLQAKKYNLKASLKSLPTNLRLFIITATVFSLGNFSYMFFVLRSESFFNDKLAVGIPIILYILYNTTYTLFAIPAGMLSDKIGRKWVLFTGYSLFGFVCLGFIFSESLPLFIILFLLFGINYALVNATEKAFVSDISDENIRGTALGTFHMMTSLAALPAGIIAGLLWDVNQIYTFIYGLALSLLTVVLLTILLQKTKQSGQYRD